MTIRSNDAAAAAARAQAEAAARARAEAARRAAEQAQQAARAKAAAKRLTARDELSTGRGSALRSRALASTGAALLKAPTSNETAPKLTVQQLLAQKNLEVPQRSAGVASPSNVATPAATPAEQARTDAASVKRSYDTAIAAGQNEAQAARTATAELDRLAQAHRGDPAYVNTLIREAGPTLDAIAKTLGDNTEGSWKGDGDAQAIKDSLSHLANVAEAGGAITAATLGDKLASKVDDDSELNQFDDGFYAHKDAGGSNLLFDATVAAMKARGMDDAAGELAERGGDGGILDTVKDGVGSVIGGIGDAFGSVVGFAKDLGEGVLHVVKEGAEFAVDVGKGTVGLIGDAASWTKDQVGGAVQYALEQGMALAGPVLDRVRDMARRGIDAGLGISESVNALKDGDSLTIGGDIHVQLGVSVDAAADIEVKRSTGPDGKPVYTVSGDVSASVGIGVGGSGSAGVGGKMEFTFDTPEEAAQAAKILASGAAGVAALTGGPTAVLAPALLPSGSDLSFLQSHLESIEVEASVGAHFDSAAGVASADIGGETGYRLNFENGRPVSMTRTTELSASGSVGGPLELLKDGLGRNLNVPGDAEAEGSVTVETTIPLEAANFTSIAEFIASPATAAVAGPATTSVTIEGTFTVAQDTGVTGSLTVSDIDASEVRGVLDRLVHGDAKHAFQGVDVNVSGSVDTFQDTGFEVGIDATVLDQGVSVEVRDEVRHRTSHHEFEVDVGQAAPASGAGGGRVHVR